MAMDELEISKIFGAGCAALLAFVGFGQLGSAVVGVDQLDEPAYVIEVAEEEGDAEGGDAAEVAALPIGQMMALADVDHGAKVFRKCASCHKVADGASGGQGPNLWGVVGRDIASMDGFAYSEVLTGKEGPWDFAALSGFLEKPRDWAPGTKMVFAGLSKPKDRASVIAWLNDQGASPLAMPAVEEAAAAEEAEEVEVAAVEEEAATETAATEQPAEETAEMAEEGVVEEAEAPEAAEEVETAEQTEEAAETAEAAEETETAEAEPKAEEAETAEATGETQETEAVEKVEEATETETAAAEPKAEEAETAEVTEEPKEAETAEAAKEEEVEVAMAETAKEEAPAKEEVAEAAKTEEKPAAAAAAAAGGAFAPAVVALMASADMDKGAKVFRKCKSCHVAEKGGKAKQGPNLYGIVGRDIAAVDGFKYSKALQEKQGGVWDIATLDAFLLKPKAWAKGTKMAFAGLRKDADRASIIAWLNAQSDNPVDLPE